MARRFFRLFAVVFGFFTALPASAAFHLWTMNELYSNADGTVQYLELTALSGSQQFLSGHELTSSNGTTTRTFTFPADLPGNTSGRRMVIATPGFAAAAGINPDYTVPTGFFFQGGGTVNFAGVDQWNHPALPSDNRSVDRSGTGGTPTPQNFAGQVGTITVSSPPALNFQGLWYRGEVESGWGVNIAHQGDTFFVTWFTYDTDGTQMWLVGPAVQKTGGGNTYTGSLFRTTGPAFSAVPFNPAQIAVTSVGSVTLAFTDANNGTMSYTVNNVTQSKPLVRQVFGTLPTCTAGGTPLANYQNLWYNAPAESEAGWGVNITHQGNILFVTWFTYDSSGRGMWVVGPSFQRTTGETFSGAFFRTTGPAFSANPWNPANVGATQVGSGSFTFTSPNAGMFQYTVNGITQTKNIVPQSFGSPATVCR